MVQAPSGTIPTQAEITEYVTANYNYNNPKKYNGIIFIQHIIKRIDKVASEILESFNAKSAPNSAIQWDFHVDLGGIHLLARALLHREPSCNASYRQLPTPPFTNTRPLFDPNTAIFTNHWKHCAISLIRHPLATPVQEDLRFPLQIKLWEQVLAGKGDGKVRFTMSDGRTLYLHQAVLVNAMIDAKELICNSELKLPKKIADLHPKTYEYAFEYLYSGRMILDIPKDNKDSYIELCLFAVNVRAPGLVNITLKQLLKKSKNEPGIALEFIQTLYKSMGSEEFAPYQDTYNSALVLILERLMNSNERHLTIPFLKSIELEELLALAQKHECPELVQALRKFALEIIKEAAVDDLVDFYTKRQKREL